jgi:hypothetical protein
MCTNATHGVCSKHRFFLRLLDKLPNPHHRQYCVRIEESVEELGECQVPDCMKIAAHMKLCKYHFFRYSELKDIPDKSVTVAHNKRLEMVATATETSYKGMSADVQAYLQQQDAVISGPLVDLAASEQKVQSLRQELNDFIGQKAEAEAAGFDAQYEAEQIDELSAEIAEADAQLAGLRVGAAVGGDGLGGDGNAAGGANDATQPAGEEVRVRRSMLDVQVPHLTDVQENLVAAPGSAVETVLELAAGERSVRVRLEEEAAAAEAETAQSEEELASVRSDITDLMSPD